MTTMNASQFSKAYRLFDRVKELDAEILELEKTAQLIAEKKTEIKLSLKVADLEKKDAKENVLDEDGSLNMNPYRLMFNAGLLEYVRHSDDAKKKKEYDVKQDASISDSVALQVLGVLLADKVEVRDLAIKKLSKLGIEI